MSKRIREEEEEVKVGDPLHKCKDSSPHEGEDGHIYLKGKCAFCRKKICKTCEYECAGCERQCCYECSRYNCNFTLCDGCHAHEFCQCCLEDVDDPIMDYDEGWCFKCKPSFLSSSSQETTSEDDDDDDDNTSSNEDSSRSHDDQNTRNKA